MASLYNGIDRLTAWNSALLNYEFSSKKKAPIADLKEQWNALFKAFQDLTALEDADPDMAEIEFCNYMREWHDEIVPPSIASFNRMFSKD